MVKPIEVSRLSKTFRHPMRVWDLIEAVRDFSFSVETGEIVGFVGHNGAGKTTTIKMMMGLIWPTGGEISIFGKKPGDVSVKNKIGFLPERPYFYSQLTGMYCPWEPSLHPQLQAPSHDPDMSLSMYQCPWP